MVLLSAHPGSQSAVRFRLTGPEERSTSPEWAWCQRSPTSDRFEKFRITSRPRECDATGSSRLVISFETRLLRTVCRDSAEAQKYYGEAAAAVLRRILADLRAANSMFDVTALFDLPTGTDSEFSTSLGAAHRLVLSFGNRKPPLLPSGEVDWNAVDRIKVLNVIANG